LPFKLNPFSGRFDFYSNVGDQGPQGEQGNQGGDGLPGADAVAGKLPSSYVELETPIGTTSETLEDVSGMSTTITLEEAVEIAVMATFEAQTQSGASASTLAVAISIDGVTYDEYQRYLSGTNDYGIGSITHRSEELAAGTYTIKLRFRRVSGVATPGLNHADMLVMAMQGAKGPQGNQGDAGSEGPQGNQGDDGSEGAQGNQGNQGEPSTVQGPQGNQGDDGIDGAQGNQGDDGAQGNQGVQGEASTVQGPQGADGAQGNQGNQGDEGAASTVQGPQGDDGTPGDQGPQGVDGDEGPQGNQGNQGDAGSQGNQGNDGNQGYQGDDGPQGEQGDSGAQGNQGDDGNQGNQGNQGYQGDDGGTGPQGDDGDPGAQGNQGNQGAQGAAGGALLLADVLAAVYPVGSIYMAIVSTSPATLFGFGTWAAFGAGKVIVGRDSGDADFDTAEETGGSKTVQSSAQTFAGSASTVIVNHTHAINCPSSASGGALKLGIDTNASGTQDSGSVTGDPVSGGAANYTPAGTNTPGAATSVVQPYIVAYMWKRTE